jgi:hypothetical protein
LCFFRASLPEKVFLVNGDHFLFVGSSVDTFRCWPFWEILGCHFLFGFRREARNCFGRLGNCQLLF